MIIILTTAAIFAVFCIFFYMNRKSGNTVVITQDGKVTGTYSINADRTIPIKDDSGHTTNTVVIEDGKVYMKSADCPDQICVKQGKKSKDGESITCLPNKVVVDVKGKEQSDIDTLIR